MTHSTEIQRMQIEKETLLEDINKKRTKILKMTMILTRNKFELCSMVKKHNDLDRKIFEDTQGITKISSLKQAEAIKQADIMSDEYIDNLSSAVKEKIYQRLKNRIELERINLLECSLTEV